MEIEYQTSPDSLFYSARALKSFRIPPANLTMPALCLELSRLSYLEFERGEELVLTTALALAGLSDFKSFSDPISGTQAFAATKKKSKQIFVVFRGSVPKDLADIVVDASALPTPLFNGWELVHGGFLVAFNRVQQEINQWLSTRRDLELIVTGHSLGAALATLAARAWAASRLITFGCPRVGNEAFARSIRSKVIERYVCCTDIVATLPGSLPGVWAHVGEEIYIDSAGRLRPGIRSVNADLDRARAVLLFRKRLDGENRVPARPLADHAPLNYLRALIVAPLP